MRLKNLCLFVFICCGVAFAEGSLSESYNSMIYFTYEFIRKIVIITGVGLCVGALIQYKQHRNNPIAVRLSMPVWLLVIGLLLIGLAYIPSNISPTLSPASL